MAQLTPLQARQSDCVSQLRSDVTSILDARANIKKHRETFAVAASAGIDSGAFDGANADLSAQDIGAALAAFNSVEALLTNADGTPTATLGALLKLRFVS